MNYNRKSITDFTHKRKDSMIIGQVEFGFLINNINNFIFLEYKS